MSRAHKRVDVDLKGRRRNNYVCGAIVSPGMALELQPDGFYDPMVSAVGEAIKKEVIICGADNLQGKSIDDAYAVGDQMQTYHPLPGDLINLLVKSAETIAIGDDLVPEVTTGLWVEAAGTEAAYQFVAVEALTPSGNEFILARRV